MKHFLQVQSHLDSFGLQRLMKQVREELRKKPLSLEEMSTKSEVICINSSNIVEYIPPGMTQLLYPKNLTTNAKLPPDFIQKINKLVEENSGHVTAYILGNIQTKELENYLDLVLGLKRDYDFEPLVLTHFSDNDLAGYLRDFLTPKIGGEAGLAQELKIEVFEEGAPTPWTTLTKPENLNLLQTGQRRPGIIQKPFFSDICLKVKVNQVEKTEEYSLGKLRTALGHFNKKRDISGMIHRAKNSLYLRWRDIDAFKLASSQDQKTIAGVSLRGEFIPVGKFISENVGSAFLKPAEVDFFRMKIGPEMVDLTPDEITEMEVNLETQQVIFTRGVGKTEFHVSRFHRLKLYKQGRIGEVHKCVSFNRGESNFEIISRYLGSRYAEYEKARALRKGSVELDYLATQKVFAGDLSAQLVLSSMRLLGVLPLEAPCLGFGPKDIKNASGLQADFQQREEDLKRIFTHILDLSSTPNFTDTDFKRLTKRITFYLAQKDPLSVTGEVMDDLLIELEHLTQYMDDFFKLNLYNRFQEELEVDQVGEETEILEIPPEEHHLDSESKDFISQNYGFFRKRELVMAAINRVELMRFYLSHIKASAEDPNLEPALVVFSSKNSLVEHYKKTAYPAFALTQVLSPDLFKAESQDEDLIFIRFMRGLTQKVFRKAQEVNQTFHHQYKHTLAELGFLASEKLEHLKEELAFLEDPANKEKAYQQLLEKITEVFQAQVKERQERIQALKQEQEDLTKEVKTEFSRLGKLLKEELDLAQIEEVLAAMTPKVEAMRERILAHHRAKRAKIIRIYNPFSKLYAQLLGYHQRWVAYISLFQKALFITKRDQLILELKKQAKQLLTLPPEQIKAKVVEWRGNQPAPEAAKEAQGRLLQKSKEIEKKLVELRQLSGKGMFQDKEKEQGPLTPYLEYYLADAERLATNVKELGRYFQELDRLEQELFDLHNQVAEARIAQEQLSLRLKVAKLALADPNSQERILTLLGAKHEVPPEIKKELSGLRTQLNESNRAFQKVATSASLEEITNFRALLSESARRDKIHDLSKHLVNIHQGMVAIGPEIEGEEKELVFLESQEENLEELAMSKALPSTRILLKTQYIPLVEREKRMLARADQFLGEVMSKGQALKDSFVNCFFRKRYAFPQFLRGSFAMDSQRGAKSNTAKNINSAYLLLGEKFANGCAPALQYEDKVHLKKIEVLGPEAIHKRVREMWTGGITDRFILLPSVYTLNEALGFCEKKEALTQEIQVVGQSRHSLILIYCGEINWAALQGNPALLDQYHRAIMSNIFIDINGVDVYNNRQSIYEALIQETFGQSNDQISQGIAFRFLNEV